MRLALLISLLAFSAPAATYYVATTGNNANAGSQGAPWAQISWAASNVVAGDVVRVQAGTYTERPFENTDGSSGSPIVYVCDGFVQVRGGFQIQGDYIWLVGFDITHSNNPSGFNYECVRIESTRGVYLFDCHIHRTDLECVTYRNSPDAMMFGCNVSHADWPNFPWPAGGGRALVWIGSSGLSSNLLFQYSQFSYSDDYFNTGSAQRDITLRNLRFGPTDSTSGAHLDNFQANIGMTNLLMEACWDEGNNNSDHHFAWNELPEHKRWIYRGNLCASRGHTGWNEGDNNYWYHNTSHTNLYYTLLSGGDGNFHIRAWEVSTGNEAYNNIFAWSADTEIFHLDTGSDIVTANYNLIFPTVTGLGANDINSDPLFQNAWTVDIRLTASSPARSAGTSLTLANGAGSSSTSLVVDNAEPFQPGDVITVGGTSATIANVSSSTAITLSSAISWSDNAVVLWEGRTDLGAIPYGRGPLGSASISANGTTYTVTPDDASNCRFVLFYVDGVPQWPPDSTAPFAITSAGTVTAKACNKYVSTNLYVSAYTLDTTTGAPGNGRFRGIRLKGL